MFTVKSIQNSLFYNQYYPKNHNHFSNNPLPLVMDLESNIYFSFPIVSFGHGVETRNGSFGS
jgi:hypothetical protein